MSFTFDSPMSRQTTSHIFMVRPTHFGFNHETASNNAFQVNDQRPLDEIRNLAVLEFDELVKTLRNSAVDVTVYQEDIHSKQTDSIFPNNWFSTHEDGAIVTYPMYSRSRREERKEDVYELLSSRFVINKHIHLEDFEKKNKFLEGTGSIVLDRKSQKAYACRSIRTDEEILNKFCAEFELEKILFDATDHSGQPIYHTNVMMSIGEDLLIICGESIKNKDQREFVLREFQNDGKEIIDISLEQMKNFSGNVLQVKSQNGEHLMVMSSRAFASFNSEQIHQIKKHCKIVHSPIPIIEQYGGGGVRCMIAEIFLPLKEPSYDL